MPLRVAECPNCNHIASAHETLDTTAEAHCKGGSAGCACPLDRAAVGIAIGIAAAMVKFG